MFGVTTPCVDGGAAGTGGPRIRLPGLPCHGDRRPGHGETGRGRADRRRARRHDHRGRRQVVGGVFPCGAERFEPILEAGVPYVLSLGALDMVNFGAMETVPPAFRDRDFTSTTPR